MIQESQLPVLGKKSIADYQIYSLYQATLENQEIYAKVFDEGALKKYCLEETIGYNMEVLYKNYKDLEFTDYILPIKKVYPHNKGLIFFTDKYDIRLSEFLKNKNLRESQVKQIAGDILKAIYGLLVAGYFHRNLRFEHFVRHKGVWKLESLVLRLDCPKNVTPNQYVALPEYRSPQLYNQENLEEKQIDEKIVWDLGSMLIDMLLGFHKLKDFQTLKKFENKEFRFSKIGATIGNTFTIQFRDVLGRMCHFNLSQRIKFKQLISDGYFSKEVAVHYLNWKSNINPEPKLKAEPKPKPKSGLALIELGSSDLESIHTNSQIQPKKSSGRQSISPTNVKSLQEIENLSEGSPLMVQFRNYFDKGQILKTSLNMIKQLSFLSEERKFKCIFMLTRYAINFIIAMDLDSLAKYLKAKSIPKLFKAQLIEWKDFCKSRAYEELNKLTVSKKNEALSKVAEIRCQILNSDNQVFKDTRPEVQDFVKNAKAQNSQYSTIKTPYRQILQKSYDLVSWHYLQEQNHEIAKIGMYLTYCLAIDKIYKPKQMKASFDFYARWINPNNPQNMQISQKNFQHYIQTAQKEELVKNSRNIIMRYFKH